MNHKQYENVLALSAKERYSHFIGKVTDWEELWGLYHEKDGWLMRVSPDDIKYLSVWPHSMYAKEIAKVHYPGHQEKNISLYDFMNHWLPKLENENIKIGVFPDFDGNTWILEPKDLLDDLREECTQYE